MFVNIYNNIIKYNQNLSSAMLSSIYYILMVYKIKKIDNNYCKSIFKDSLEVIVQAYFLKCRKW